MSLDLRVSENILQIGEAKALKAKIIHTLSESKSISVIEQRLLFHASPKCCMFIGTPDI